MRRANVRYFPDTSEEYPWNVGLYDDENGDKTVGGYVESVGAIDHSEAIKIADHWTRTGKRLV